jgi:hypothetical protein
MAPSATHFTKMEMTTNSKATCAVLKVPSAEIVVALSASATPCLCEKFLNLRKTFSSPDAWGETHHQNACQKPYTSPPEAKMRVNVVRPAADIIIGTIQIRTAARMARFTKLAAARIKWKIVFGMMTKIQRSPISRRFCIFISNYFQRFPKFYPDFKKIPNFQLGFPKVSKDFQRFPNFQGVPKISNVSTISKDYQGSNDVYESPVSRNIENCCSVISEIFEL